MINFATVRRWENKSPDGLASTSEIHEVVSDVRSSIATRDKLVAGTDEIYVLKLVALRKK